MEKCEKCGQEIKKKKVLGRPKGIPCKPETKEKIQAAIKEAWKRQKAQKNEEVLD